MRLKDPVEGYYDPRDVYTTVPRSSVLDTPYASHISISGAPGALKGLRLGVIRESMTIPPGSKTEEPIVGAVDDGDQNHPRRAAGRHARGVLRPAVDARSRYGADDRRFPARAGATGAGVHAGSTVPARPGRNPAVQGIRGGDRADRVHARKGVRLGHDGADRLLRRTGGGTDRSRRKISTSAPSSSRNWRTRSASTFRSIFRGAPPTGRQKALPRR